MQTKKNVAFFVDSNLILNEKLGKFDYICLFACFVGAVFVLRQGMDF